MPPDVLWSESARRRRFFTCVALWLALGCLYQSSCYGDLTLARLVSGDVPISAIGHIVAWPFVLLWHGLTGLAWACLIVAVLLILSFIWAGWGDEIAAAWARWYTKTREGYRRGKAAP